MYITSRFLYQVLAATVRIHELADSYEGQEKSTENVFHGYPSLAP